jgi:FtsP/CotA-like multicopper oxidase with cupredoxin domain
MCKKGLKRFIGIFLSLIFLSVMVGTASAVTDVFLRADTMMLTLPDGLGGTTSVPMWGFAQETAFDNTTGTVSVPGPLIVVPPGETLLRIHLDNNLPDPVSLQINGLRLTNNGGPVWSELGATAPAFSGSRPMGNYTARVRSFSHETPPGNTTDVIYEFDVTARPGTFPYSSATNPAKHVQMGLYGGVKIDMAAGEAYPGVFYDKEVVLIYSEVDPLINAAVNTGQYGPGGTITSSLHRDPKYFLVNGMAFEPAGGLDPVNSATPINPGDTVLVRFLNAGYETHVPQLLNMYMSLVAEDGNLYAYPKEQYGIQLPAGKTVDAILTPTATGRFPIYDAAHNLTNNGTPAMGGMLAYLSVGAAVSSCPGDFDGDGDVDGLDLAELAAGIEQLDLATFATYFGRNDCLLVGP